MEGNGNNAGRIYARNVDLNEWESLLDPFSPSSSILVDHTTWPDSSLLMLVSTSSFVNRSTSMSRLLRKAVRSASFFRCSSSRCRRRPGMECPGYARDGARMCIARPFYGRAADNNGIIRSLHSCVQGLSSRRQRTDCDVSPPVSRYISGPAVDGKGRR